mgnify:CR=1 FL=1
MHFYIKTTRIDLGFPFAASAAVILMLDKSGTALLIFLCCALHEAGHILLLTLCSAPPDAIILGVFGMRIERGGELSLVYRREAVCALAGPAANFIVSLAALPFVRVYPNALKLAALSAGIGVFNLLPVEPMDGAAALKSLLLLKHEEHTADKVVDIFAAVLLIPLTVCGIILLIKTGNNFTLLCVCIYISVYLIAKKRTA